MNKLFTKIGVAFAGIAMAVGVGAAVGHEQKPEKVEADTTETLIINAESHTSDLDTSTYSTDDSSQNTSASNSIGLSWANAYWHDGGVQIKKGGVDTSFFKSTSYVGNYISALTITDGTNTSRKYVSKNGTSWSAYTGSSMLTEANGYKYFKVCAESSSRYAVVSSISVTYYTKATVTINHIAVSDYSEKTWYRGDTFNNTDITVTPYTSQDDSSPLDAITDGSGVTFGDNDATSVTLAAGSNTIKVNYGGASKNISVTAVDADRPTLAVSPVNTSIVTYKVRDITFTPSNFSGTPTYTAVSSDTTVATVVSPVVTTKGKITATGKPGTCTITWTATYNSEVATAVTNVTVLTPQISIGFDSTTISLFDGAQSYDITPTNFASEARVYSVVSSNTNVLTVSTNDSDETLTVTPVAGGSSTVTLSVLDEAGREASKAITFTVSSSVSYTRISGTSDLVIGDTYAIAFTGKYSNYYDFAVGRTVTTSTNNNYLSGLSISIASNSFTSVDNMGEFVLIPGTVSGKYALYEKNIGKYLACATEKRMSFASSLSSSCNFSLGESNEIIFTDVDAALKYNMVSASDSRVYTNASTTNYVNLFRAAISSKTEINIAKAWLNDDFSDVSCNNGATEPSTETWALIENSYGEITNSAAKNILKYATYAKTGSGSQTVVTATNGTDDSVAQAMAKYDYIIAKYNILLGRASDYPNFISRTVTAEQMNSNQTNALFALGLSSGDNSAITIIVVISLVSLIAVGGYFLLKKKKEQ